MVEKLTWTRLEGLITDKSDIVKEQALFILRNLVFGDADAGERNINRVLDGFGEKLVDHLSMFLLEKSNPKLHQQALYIINNIASGSVVHKKFILKSDVLLKSISNSMTHKGMLFVCMYVLFCFVLFVCKYVCMYA